MRKLLALVLISLFVFSSSLTFAAPTGVGRSTSIVLITMQSMQSSISAWFGRIFKPYPSIVNK